MCAYLSSNDESDNEHMDSILTRDEDSGDNDEGPQPCKRRRVNNVWGNIEQENILDEQFNRIGMNKIITDREVESYVQYEDPCPPIIEKKACQINENGRKRKSQKPVKERLSPRDWDRSKPRDHVKSTIDSDPTDVVQEIAGLLQEKKMDLIEKCVSILGVQKTLDLYFITEDIEDSGGLMIMSGMRRRTPGGVFLTILRSSEDITKDQIKKIFESEDKDKKKMKRARQKSKKVKDVFESLLEQRRREILLENQSEDDLGNVVSPDISLDVEDSEMFPNSKSEQGDLEDGEIADT